MTRRTLVTPATLGVGATLPGPRATNERQDSARRRPAAVILRRRMSSHRRALGCPALGVVLAGLAFGAGPASASATCSFDPVSGDVGIVVADGYSATDVSQGALLVDGSMCAPMAQVAAIEVGESDSAGLDIKLDGAYVGRAGTWVPWRVHIDGLVIDGGAGRDHVVVGATGADLNGDGTGDVALSSLPSYGIQLNGGPGDDYLSARGDSSGTGGPDPNRVLLMGGTDLVTTNTGNDRLYGGAGDDFIIGGDGNDVVDGGDGNDEIEDSGPVSGIIGYDDGDDILSGGAGDDTFDQQAAGSDTIWGGTGVDSVYYNGNDAGVSVTLDGVRNDGNAADGQHDNVEPDVEDVYGSSAGDSTLVGDAADNYLWAGGGGNVLHGGDGNDTLVAEGGPGNASNTLYGDAGDDTIVGSDGPDRLFGGTGNDQLMGYGGNDVIGGQGGNDLIVTGEPDGADLISGGPGVDTVSYSDSNGARAAGVHVTLDNSANDGASGEGDNVRSDVENVTGTSGPDVLAGDTAPNRLNGLGGHDRLLGESGNDTIEAQDGVADLVDGGPGTDRAFLDCGLDRFTNVEGRIC